ncbi:globin family protein [Oceanicoccus sp. KOV_DT_Chl]|uniref:globin family protein n=1 Tax=Oceanicoccus sp. KOV_DT_Chl TaxID=1904639 RepID=UPI000C796937|nr:globin family protein [Oceanicoccus sp. KOV_DT_Chl]
MTPEQIQLCMDSWSKVEPIADDAAVLFYNNLFEADPELKPLFKGNMVEQGKKLMQMITAAVRMLDNLDQLVPIVQKLGIRHAGYGVVADHYDTVGAALLKTLSMGLGDEFTEEVETAWTEAYGILAATMIAAAEAEPVT